MIKVKHILTTTGLTLALPLMAFAQNSDPELGAVRSLLTQFGNLVRLALPIAVALALLFFIWGLAKFILAGSGGDEGAREEGKNKMLWGVIALFAIVSVWGLVGLLGELFGVDTDGQTVDAPGIDLNP